MSTSVNLVVVEAVVEVVDTVVMTVGDIVDILSVSIIEVAESMVRKDVGKNEAVVVGEIAPTIFCCKQVHFGTLDLLFTMCNQIYFLFFHYRSDIQ